MQYVGDRQQKKLLHGVKISKEEKKKGLVHGLKQLYFKVHMMENECRKKKVAQEKNYQFVKNEMESRFWDRTPHVSS